jgi:hypothetical protein
MDVMEVDSNTPNKRRHLARPPAPYPTPPWRVSRPSQSPLRGPTQKIKMGLHCVTAGGYQKSNRQNRAHHRAHGDERQVPWATLADRCKPWSNTQCVVGRSFKSSPGNRSMAARRRLICRPSRSSASTLVRTPPTIALAKIVAAARASALASETPLPASTAASIADVAISMMVRSTRWRSALSRSSLIGTPLSPCLTRVYLSQHPLFLLFVSGRTKWVSCQCPIPRRAYS